MTKRELIESLEASDCSDDTPVVSATLSNFSGTISVVSICEEDITFDTQSKRLEIKVGF
jgi:hypothetical protein